MGAGEADGYGRGEFDYVHWDQLIGAAWDEEYLVGAGLVCGTTLKHYKDQCVD